MPRRIRGKSGRLEISIGRNTSTADEEKEQIPQPPRTSGDERIDENTRATGKLTGILTKTRGKDSITLYECRQLKKYHRCVDIAGAQDGVASRRVAQLVKSE